MATSGHRLLQLLSFFQWYRQALAQPVPELHLHVGWYQDSFHKECTSIGRYNDAVYVYSVVQHRTADGSIRGVVNSIIWISSQQIWHSLP